MKIPESFVRAACAIEVCSWDIQQLSSDLHQHMGSESHLQRVASRLDDGVYTTIAQPLRGAVIARRLARPLIKPLDLFFGTGRRHQPLGVTTAGAAAGANDLFGHQERLDYAREVFSSLKSHPSDIGVCGVVAWVPVALTAAAAACLGAAVGAVFGCARYPFKSHLDASTRLSFVAFVSQATTWGAERSGRVAGEVAMWLVSAPLTLIRVTTWLLKVGVTGVGAGAGFLTGLGKLSATELSMLVGFGTAPAA